MLENIPISAFKSATSIEPTTVFLSAFLKSTRHREKILALRAETEKKKRDELKKSLPAATISGTFIRRAAGQIETYNGLVCLDFDAADNPSLSPTEMKLILSEFPEVAYAAVSVGGAGVFAIVPTNNRDPTRHAPVVDLLGMATKAHGLNYDRACKDVSRLRFVSYDPEAYWNQNPQSFDTESLFQIQQPKADLRPPRAMVFRQKPDKEGTDTRSKVEAYIQALEGSCRDVTENYDDWLKIGFALASEFGTEGEGYFQRVSQFNPKYNPQDASKKFENALKNGKSVKIASFFKILHDQNIRL
jgi:hypothetical protein